MEKTKENEELLKDKIFEIYINCKSETSSDRRQVYILQLAEHIYKWCEDYLPYRGYDKRSKQSEVTGEEIFKIAIRLFRENSKTNIPEDKSRFFGYIINSLKTAKKEFERDFLSKNENNIIRMQESYLGRRMSEDERLNVTNIWFEHEIVGYSNIDYLLNSNIAIICEAVRSVLEEIEDNQFRNCCRALFTQYCMKKRHTESLYAVLDQDIINRFDDKKPARYEIWQKYYPQASINSAGSQASTELKDFLRNLELYLKEKYPEIFY